jgi:ubiquinone/menaquinone biosynthesis C-methylase UbiE
MTEQAQAAVDDNAETIEAWDGPLFRVFADFREAMTPGLDAQGRTGFEVAKPQPGERVLDIGCGFGDTTKDLARMVAPDGEAVGVDVSPQFIEAAGQEAEAAGIDNASFAVRDVQTDDLGGPFDLAYARFGTMFFANPVAALRRVREALTPGGRIAFVVWRQREDNVWLYLTQQIVESFVQRPEEYDEPTCGPGPFSMANADTVGAQLIAAGYTDVAFHRFDRPMRFGRDLEEAVDLNMALGPGGEIIRLLGDRLSEEKREEIRAAVTEGLRQFESEDGIAAPASVWVVAARNPA